MSTIITTQPQIHYPDSDGKPMAENTIQFRWITTIQGNLDLLFNSRPDVFVAGDNYWYPVKAKPKLCTAPDIYVVFGLQKGDRGSYKQWEENDIPLSVVFEILSPSNSFSELLDKFEFYQKYGVQEYYIIDPKPQHIKLDIFEREHDRLQARHPLTEWVSPLMGVRFAVTPGNVELCYPDGRPFLSFVELGERQKQIEEALKTERERTEKLAAKLRELGVDPDAV
jgi:Uma2 family endonuclease